MPTRTRIKICGITRLQDLQSAVDAGADAIGLVFYDKSPRFVTPEQGRLLSAGLPAFVSAVGLFVNAKVEAVVDCANLAALALLQFHGDETPEQCAQLAAAAQRPFIKALRIKTDCKQTDLLECEAVYRDASPWFRGLLLDAWVDGYGGGGQAFDWSLIPPALAPKIVLSGGLNPQNIQAALTHVQPYAVDVSSGVELRKGIKDAALIQAFIASVRRADAAC